ncbi:MAG TPA: bifunctional diaminohydroxyphosphoribosylaminopyrimidine deaminase/5-amino-6-(5-phosphoribosylamino)uracil reductase RibD [Cryomorphaceae bacterium]|nr:bifunctional diaminohydroxyphosphoribosylaminopyrimidine deaminase/5-amino-6-(5-phosphoribosylamino)uracil reductase RibD [Cryomorphaceae bacterium]
MDHSKFLTRCLQLANYGRGTASPNPMVGAVVVHNGSIIGEGYHRKAGESHAEVMAIKSVENAALLKQSTLYCSLEPCAHYGRTPPCCELISSHGIPHVVIGTGDPHSKVDGKGVAHLRDHGIKVEFAPSPIIFQRLNEVFWTNMTKNRPYFSLKWAENASGHIDRNRTAEEQPLRISGPLATLRTHQLRAHVDGILVSSKTACFDRPGLTTRNWSGQDPTPIILFGQHFPLQGEWVSGLEVKPFVIGNPLPEGFSGITCDPKDLHQWAPKLLDFGLNHVLVEGGARVLQSFIDAGFADSIHRYVSEDEIEDGVIAPRSIKLNSMSNLGNDRYDRS